MATAAWNIPGQSRRREAICRCRECCHFPTTLVKFPEDISLCVFFLRCDPIACWPWKMTLARPKDTNWRRIGQPCCSASTKPAHTNWNRCASESTWSLTASTTWTWKQCTLPTRLVEMCGNVWKYMEEEAPSVSGLPAFGTDCLASDGCRILAARIRVRRGTRYGMGLRRRSAAELCERTVSWNESDAWISIPDEFTGVKARTALEGTPLRGGQFRPFGCGAVSW